MATKNSQKFLAQNRAPRVQVEYDVELYGAEKKVNLPFVMGVMSDLSGKPKDPLPRVDERKFVEIDADNFDERLKSMKPRVAFQVPNVINGDGNLAVSYMDGKTGAEELISKILSDPALLKALAGQAKTEEKKPGSDTEEGK